MAQLFPRYDMITGKMVYRPMLVAASSSDIIGSFPGGAANVQFATGVDAGFVRGTTDTDRADVAGRRSDGTKVYVGVDTGTTLAASTTAP